MAQNEQNNCNFKTRTTEKSWHWLFLSLPSSGPHRYVFLVWQQQQAVSMESPRSRLLQKSSLLIDFLLFANIRLWTSLKKIWARWVALKLKPCCSDVCEGASLSFGSNRSHLNPFRTINHTLPGHVETFQRLLKVWALVHLLLETSSLLRINRSLLFDIIFFIFLIALNNLLIRKEMYLSCGLLSFGAYS